MWKVASWFELGSYDTELTAYQLLHRLQDQYIPRHFGIVRLCITSESTPLHPITDVVQRLVLEYILALAWRSSNQVSDAPNKKPRGYPAT